MLYKHVRIEVCQQQKNGEMDSLVDLILVKSY